MYIKSLKKILFLQVLIIFTVFITALSCSDTPNRTDNCKKTGCKDKDKICNEDTGKCEYPKRCTETGCPDGKVCDELTGLCLDKPDCTTEGCPEFEYCDPVTKECKENCPEGKCAANETCIKETGECKPDCTKVNCPDNFECDEIDATCKPVCLNNEGCEVTEHCNEETGLCEPNCPEGKCAANERCLPLTGKCIIDCSNVQCPEESQLCDPSDGVCKPACEVNKCENKQKCNEQTGQCEETPLSQYQTPCENDEDCLSGLCIELNENTKVCTVTCNITDEEGCKEGWDCYPYHNQSVCAPIENNSCNPCTTDEDCSPFGGKCITLGSEKHCFDSCDYSDNCTNGFTCTEKDINGDTYKLCIPQSQSCDCNSENLNLSLTCELSNEYGTCQGSKTCMQDGWSQCDGQEATPEICDGIDNDCNGLIDDLEIESCQNTNEYGTCTGNLLCNNGTSVCDAPMPKAEVCNGLDDDCNGEIDDLAPMPCNVSNEFGTCEGFRECGGENGWLDCNAQIPEAETCNGIDDNCNGQTDENLDGTCSISNEFGTCFGERRCLGENGWDECDAQVPTYDFCDGKDNNCNGQTDEENEHLFDNCSDMANANLTCNNGACKLVSCLENYYNIDKDDSNGCEYHCVFDTFQDIPDGTDHNCDGIDGNINDAYFVSGRIGSDSNPGTMQQPFKTITYALNKAKIMGYSQVIVAAGDYNEDLVFRNEGVSIFGGYEDITWQRNITQNITRIIVPPHGIRFENITQDTYLDGFTVVSGNASTYPENSIGIYAINSGTNLKLKNLTINPGNGMPGLNGNQVYIAQNGHNGGDGENGGDGDNDDENEPGDGGEGGINSACPLANGGAGGGGGWDDHHSGYDGQPGVLGTPGGSGGSGSGNDGANGNNATTPGANGENGLGGLAGGEVINGEWRGHNGNNGNDGTPGAGGGGGGGGAAQYGGWVNDGAGNGGGGGAAGGCGGQGGAGGTAGTGSFGIFLVNSSPVIMDVHINAGNGGTGGTGGIGGTGGNPGNPGQGGNKDTDEVGRGGNGGNGAKGGNGGSGGGGAGGDSYCIYRHNSQPDLVSWTCNQGQGGRGGSAGSADGNNGQNGISGELF